MSSYYPSFNYMGINSFKDKSLIVTHFESGDDGEVNTFLSMEPVFTEHALGTHRIDYGARYTDVAVIKITVMKSNASDFAVDEVRDFLRWTTGARQNSYLDLLDGDDIKFSFLGRVTNVFQQKLDARTIGFVIEFTSTSPWAYSPIQEVVFSMKQALAVDENGVLNKNGESVGLIENGILKNGNNGFFDIDNDGTMYIDVSFSKIIDNNSDDLYSYVYLNAIFHNKTACEKLVIDNSSIGEATEIYNISENETITLTSEQFIMSDKTRRIFGNDFNFVWPRLKPGRNQISVSGIDDGELILTYRYPIKIGDCAIDTYSGCGIICGDNSSANSSNNGNGNNSSGDIIVGTLAWENITNKPTTRDGYKLSDVYTVSEVNYKIDSAELKIDEADFNRMLTDALR